MKKKLILILLLASQFGAFANDGVFYAAGNQLIPITETDISVKKEVLTITRQGNYAFVDVYYEFYNPVGEKELLVGFEAMAPYNAGIDFSILPNGQPYISDFSVVMNQQAIPFQVAFVNSLNKYYENGKFDLADPKKVEEEYQKTDFIQGVHVYHFKAKFIPGINIIHHQYKYLMSNSVMCPFEISYILTAANRWANHQIDDFTLNIDMGEHSSFRIKKTFYDRYSQWMVQKGAGRQKDARWDEWDDTGYTVFHIQRGSITFQKKDFHPDGELIISHVYGMWEQSAMNPDSDIRKQPEKYILEVCKLQYDDHLLALNHLTLDSLYFTSKELHTIQKELSKNTKLILRDLPLAYRGYIFEDKKEQSFFESTQWYIPNPFYKGSDADFSEEEREWVKSWNELLQYER